MNKKTDKGTEEPPLNSAKVLNAVVRANHSWQESTLAERIKHLITCLDVGQNEFARMCDMSHGTMSRLANNHRQLGGAPTYIRKIAAATGFSYAWLQSGQGQPTDASTGSVAEPGGGERAAIVAALKASPSPPPNLGPAVELFMRRSYDNEPTRERLLSDLRKDLVFAKQLLELTVTEA